MVKVWLPPWVAVTGPADTIVTVGLGVGLYGDGDRIGVGCHRGFDRGGVILRRKGSGRLDVPIHAADHRFHAVRDQMVVGVRRGRYFKDGSAGNGRAARDGSAIRIGHGDFAVCGLDDIHNMIVRRAWYYKLLRMPAAVAAGKRHFSILIAGRRHGHSAAAPVPVPFMRGRVYRERTLLCVRAVVVANAFLQAGRRAGRRDNRRPVAPVMLGLGNERCVRRGIAARAMARLYARRPAGGLYIDGIGFLKVVPERLAVGRAAHRANRSFGAGGLTAKVRLAVADPFAALARANMPVIGSVARPIRRELVRQRRAVGTSAHLAYRLFSTGGRTAAVQGIRNGFGVQCVLTGRHMIVVEGSGSPPDLKTVSKRLPVGCAAYLAHRLFGTGSRTAGVRGAPAHCGAAGAGADVPMAVAISRPSCCKIMPERLSVGGIAHLAHRSFGAGGFTAAVRGASAHLSAACADAGVPMIFAVARPSC